MRPVTDLRDLRKRASIVNNFYLQRIDIRREQRIVRRAALEEEARANLHLANAVHLNQQAAQLTGTMFELNSKVDAMNDETTQIGEDIAERFGNDIFCVGNKFTCDMRVSKTLEENTAFLRPIRHKLLETLLARCLLRNGVQSHVIPVIIEYIPAGYLIFKTPTHPIGIDSHIHITNNFLRGNSNSTHRAGLIDISSCGLWASERPFYYSIFLYAKNSDFLNYTEDPLYVGWRKSIQELGCDFKCAASSFVNHYASANWSGLLNKPEITVFYAFESNVVKKKLEQAFRRREYLSI